MYSGLVPVIGIRVTNITFISGHICNYLDKCNELMTNKIFYRGLQF